MSDQKYHFHHPKDYIAATETILHIPRAQDWRQGVSIHVESDSNTIFFRVLEHLNRGTRIEPHVRTILTDATGEHVLALLKYNRRSFRPHWCIYVANASGGCPHRSSTDSATTSGDRDQLPPNMGLYALLYNTGEVTVVSCNNESRLEDGGADGSYASYHYTSIRGGKICWCGGSSRRVVQVMYQNDTESNDAVAFVRDQFDETMTVSAGESLLLAAALAYAIDRRYKPLGSKEEQSERAEQARHRAQVLGLKGKGRLPSDVAESDATITLPLTGKGVGLHILESSESQDTDAVLITLAETPLRGGTAPVAATSPFHPVTKPSKAPRTRRQRQMSAPILEMEGDVSKGHDTA